MAVRTAHTTAFVVVSALVSALVSVVAGVALSRIDARPARAAAPFHAASDDAAPGARDDDGARATATAAPDDGDGVWRDARAHALAALQAGHLDDALRLLDDAERNAPASARPALQCDQAAVLSRRARAIVDVDLRAAERDLRRALASCPTQEALRSSLAAVLHRRAQDNDDRGARHALLRESIDVQPTAASLYELGRMLEEDDDQAGAITAWKQALALEPDSAIVQSALRRLEQSASVDGAFRSARHSHFVARFEGPGEERLAYAALDVLEHAYFTIGQSLGLWPDQPIVVVIYTGSQYQQATATPDWSSAIFDGKIRIREATLAAERGTLEDTLVHEYVHAALRNCVPSSVPTWMHEGLARHYERTRVDVAPLLQRRGWPPLQQLGGSFLGLSADDAALAYAASTTMVAALVQQRGTWGLHRLFGAMRNGKSFDDAFTESFGRDVTQTYASLAQGG